MYVFPGTCPHPGCIIIIIIIIFFFFFIIIIIIIIIRHRKHTVSNRWAFLSNVFFSFSSGKYRTNNAKCKLKGKPKLPSECKLVAATAEATPVVPASGAQVADGVEERQPIRASLPRACKKTSDVKPEDTPSNLPAEKMKPRKKPSEYQSAVARHLAESKECAMAYSDSSFRVVRACPLSSNLEIMEALYIKALAPNLCVQKSSITHLQLFRHR